LKTVPQVSLLRLRLTAWIMTGVGVPDWEAAHSPPAQIDQPVQIATALDHEARQHPFDRALRWQSAGSNPRVGDKSRRLRT
jgi:hypothetical protein